MHNHERSTKTTAPVIIAGAGHSGVAVAAGLRARGWNGGILLLDAGTETPYERPPLSKELLKDGAPDESAVLRKAKFYQDREIDLLAGNSPRQRPAGPGLLRRHCVLRHLPRVP